LFSTNTVVATFAVGTFPYGVAVNPDGSRVYIANEFSSDVSVIDTSTNTVVATVAVGSAPYGGRDNPGWRLRLCRQHSQQQRLGHRHLH
jgi:YVTN family beta-propeller protein